MSEDISLWFEKYRPSCLEECILPKAMMKIFKGYVEKKEMPNLMLTGFQGTGKTTLAKVMVKELNADSMFVDCSTDNGKAMIETQVVPFASTLSLGNQEVPKIIICDECIEEHETVRIGTVDDWKDVPIRELDWGKEYPVVSFNSETETLENDTAHLVVDRETYQNEVMLSGGITIKTSGSHPFLCKESDGTWSVHQIKDGIAGRYCGVWINGKLELRRVDFVLRSYKKKIRVMDIEVHKNHTFITSNGIITHNCDGLSAAAQKSFRPVIEKYALTTRFIFTANYPEKIIPALKSRCACFDFSQKKTEKPQMMAATMKRCKHILDDNQIKYDSKVLGMFIAKWHPDFRRILNELQSYATGNGAIDEGILTAGTKNDIADQLYPLILAKEFTKCKQWVADSIDSPEDIFAALYNRMNDYVKPELQSECIIQLAAYQEYSSHVMNQQINTMALLVELMNSIGE